MWRDAHSLEDPFSRILKVKAHLKLNPAWELIQRQHWVINDKSDHWVKYSARYTQASDGTLKLASDQRGLWEKILWGTLNMFAEWPKPKDLYGVEPSRPVFLGPKANKKYINTIFNFHRYFHEQKTKY